MSESRREHWEQVYTTKASTDVSWYQQLPARSLALLRALPGGIERRIIDVGGGDSTLVDAVVRDNLGTMTVLDLSGAALARARARLGESAAQVTWLEADVTEVELSVGSFDLWHDRAVFHFLTEQRDRERYVEAARAAVRAGGRLLLSTFAPTGPPQCSGLRVARYSPDALATELRSGFRLERHFEDVHRTPAGREQHFTVAQFIRE